MIVVAVIAAIAIVCAIVFGIKLAGGNNSEEVTEALVNTETTVVTTEATTQALTTSAPTTIETADLIPQDTTTKKQTSNSGGLVVGKSYKTLPINVKTKGIRSITWRGSYTSASDDMSVSVKFDKNYKPTYISIVYHKPDIRSNLFKSMSMSYRPNGEAAITMSTYLGATSTYTEDEFISRMGSTAAYALDTFDRLPVLLFLDPMVYMEDSKPNSVRNSKDYVYLGKETIKTGEAYKFEKEFPDMNATIYFWVDAKTGALVKFNSLENGKEYAGTEATEIQIS